MNRGDRAVVTRSRRSGASLALERLRLAGAMFLRAEYSEAWTYESLDGPTTAGMLHPGAERVILFHVVAAGTCWIALRDSGDERFEDKHWATAGDVIVLPYGDQHVMGGTEPAELVSLGELVAPPPWPELPVIRHGGGGDRTDVVCGYLQSQDPLFDPALRALPPVFVVRPPAGPAADWVAASIAFALEASSGTAAGSTVATTRLPELLLVEILRLHLASAPAVDHGFIAALHDPVLAPAMAHLHAEPDRKWTVREIASEVAVSRSLLDARFRQVLGRSPIRYLAEWRMHLAKELLAMTTLTVGAISRRVGYDSEEAFSRAFKRACGRAPGEWRASAG